MNKMIPVYVSILSATLLSSAYGSDVSNTDTQPSPSQQVKDMKQQLATMKNQLQKLSVQNEKLAAQVQQVSQAQASTQPVQPLGISPNLSLWGYGEIYYTNPIHDNQHTEFDLARAVFGIGYKLDDKTEFNSEFEVEHAVASASDRGEFEVEQFYVDRSLTDWANVKGGLFLMPFGLLNEHHEPTNFYGVQRNFVETLIIPSTWREGGIGFHGDTVTGFNWDGGVTTGIDLSGWNNSPEDPQYRTALDLEDNDVAPMQATHQELQLANAQHLSQYVAINYVGVPGLLTGAAIFTGKAAIPKVPTGLPDQRVTLWEAHARWTPGAADISAVYAHGMISSAATYNNVNAGVANPLPSEFLGYYLQAAYTVWQHNDYRISPFVRWEHYDMGASYQGILPGFTTVPVGLAADGKPWPQPQDRVWTAGANFYFNSHTVVKADFQHFSVNTDFTRFDLGLGISY